MKRLSFRLVFFGGLARIDRLVAKRLCRPGLKTRLKNSKTFEKNW
jgi:hypothetical protein